ncbi:Hok/Gef family protein [Escherichia coli]|uniref:Hok/Gef family protein n=1 Tax=Escherichia coli TaxID=562 RepID=UPI003DA93D24
MTKYALIGLLAVCATVLCFSLIFRERLCELNIHRGNTVVQVTLAYEAQQGLISSHQGHRSPAFRVAEVFQGQTPETGKSKFSPLPAFP